jgi:hypothetical protein
MALATKEAADIGITATAFPLFKKLKKEDILKSMDDKNSDFKTVSKNVFKFINGDAALADKKEVMKKFCEKYKEKALAEIYSYTGANFSLKFPKDNNFDKLLKEKPAFVTEMRTLAEGFAYFGYDGFRAMLRLLGSSIDFSVDFSKDKYPFSVTIAYVLCHLLKKRENFNEEKEKMYQHGLEYLKNESIGLPTKKIIVEMLGLLDEKNKERLKNEQSLPAEVESLLR